MHRDVPKFIIERRARRRTVLLRNNDHHLEALQEIERFVDRGLLTASGHPLSPRSVAFRTEPMPLSGAGKILKTELRKPHWEGRGKQVN